MKTKFLLFSAMLLTCGSLWAQDWIPNGSTVYTNGNVGIGLGFDMVAPMQTLDVNGTVRIRSLSLPAQQDNTLGRVLVSDASGNLYWRDVLTIGGSFSGSFADLTGIPANLDTDATDDFDGDFASLTNIPAELDDGDDVNDADADPENEYNTGFQVNGTNLEITDNGGTLSVPIANISGGTFPSFPQSAGDGGGNTNSFFGHRAGLDNLGLNNTFIGFQSGFTNTSGAQNTFIGRRSGYGNETGSYNVFIGYNAGANAGFGTDNKLYIDNSDSNTPLIWGDFTDGNEQLIFNGNVQIEGDLEVNTITATQIEGDVSWSNLTDVPANLDTDTTDDFSGSFNDLSDVPANLDTDATNDFSGSFNDLSDVPDAFIPEGVILMWSGEIMSIPDGWAVCDGNNGTPDLRERFVVGAGINGDVTGDAYNSGDTGGQYQVMLTQAQMPSHDHDGSIGSGEGSHIHTGSTTSDGNHTHPLDNEGGDNDGDGDIFDMTDEDGGVTESILYTTEDSGGHSHTITTNMDEGSHDHSFTSSIRGSNEAHENRPPYYALYYIMKLNIEILPKPEQPLEGPILQQDLETVENTDSADNNEQLPDTQDPSAPVKKTQPTLEGEDFALYQNVPNPFHTVTTIEAIIPEGIQQAQINVYNLNGQELDSYDIGQRGKVSLEISAGKFPSGMYLYALLADGRHIDTKKMILTR